MATINGQKGAYAQPIVYGRDGNGRYTIKKFAGTRSEIQQLIPQVEQGGATWTINESVSGANDVMEARFPVDLISVTIPEAPINDWEYFSGKSQKDLLEADVPIINALTENEKIGLAQYMADPGPDTTPARTPASDYDKLFKQVQRGLKSAQVRTPTLRHTQTVSNTYAIQVSFANVGRLLSTASLISLEGVPTDLLFNLPTGTTTIEDAAYSWLKGDPTVRIAAGRRIQIEQEWEYDLWSTIVYQAVL